MQPKPEKPDPLERVIDRTLRQLPVRPAPRSLEQRVLAELARRSSRPWWRKSFAHWPLAARGVFLVACVAVVKLVLMASVWVSAGFDPAQYREAIAQRFGWLDAVAAVGHAIGSSLEILVRSIPPLWLYGAGAVFAVMYMTLFGLGAAAYKALQAHR